MGSATIWSQCGATGACVLLLGVQSVQWLWEIFWQFSINLNAYLLWPYVFIQENTKSFLFNFVCKLPIAALLTEPDTGHSSSVLPCFNSWVVNEWTTDGQRLWQSLRNTLNEEPGQRVSSLESVAGRGRWWWYAPASDRQRSWTVWKEREPSRCRKQALSHGG